MLIIQNSILVYNIFNLISYIYNGILIIAADNVLYNTRINVIFVCNMRI